MNIILASASPRRREILSHLGLHFTVLVADADESSTEQNAERLVEQLAAKKAAAVRDQLVQNGTLTPDTIIIAADTVVVSPSGRILGKPRTSSDAHQMLTELSDRTHQVTSGIAVLSPEKLITAHETTEVTFGHLTEDVIDRYIASDEPMDKAGAYGIQDTASLWISGIKGDYFNVVGLPIHRLEQTLNKHFSLSLWH